MANILVYIELEGRTASRQSLTALSIGRRVASRLGGTLYAVLPCAAAPSYSEDDVVARLSQYGADKVALLTDQRLQEPTFYATHGEAVRTVCRRFPPLLMIFPANAGAELGPRIAFDLNATYLPSTTLTFDDDGISFAQPVFRGGLLWRDPLERYRPVVMTLRPNVEPAVARGVDEAEVVVVDLPENRWPDVRARVAAGAGETGGTSASRRVVVGGGGGLSDARAFELLARFAQTIGAELAASQTACARGLAADELRVGFDGRSIVADTYIAFGISGSERHMAGILPSTEVIAVNSDPDAPIFRVATHGLVADAVETLEALLSESTAGQDG